MRKLFWVSWCLLLLVFVASYFRFAALDLQPTHTIWIQVATADGGARLVVLRGDPSASWTANTVIERDKNTFRYGLSTAPWGRMSYLEMPVDTLGTLVATYRVDVPLLGPLLIPLALMLAAWAMKRWGAPPRLVWAELWTTARITRGAYGFFRRAVLVLCIVFAFGAALVWAGSYLDPMPQWQYFGTHLALVTGNDALGFSVLRNQAGSSLAFAESLTELRNKQIEKLGRPEKYFSIEIMRERIAFRYYTADDPSGGTIPPARHEFIGFGFSRDRVEMPSIVSPFPTRLFFGRGAAMLPLMPGAGAAMPPLIPGAGGTMLPLIPGARAAMLRLMPGAGAALGVERTLILRLWAPVIVFGVWPLWCFFRGPLRRARRRAAGCCPPCGYDLTGLTEPRCPECGTAFAPETVRYGQILWMES